MDSPESFALVLPPAVPEGEYLREVALLGHHLGSKGARPHSGKPGPSSLQATAREIRSGRAGDQECVTARALVWPGAHLGVAAASPPPRRPRRRAGVQFQRGDEHGLRLSPRGRQARRERAPSVLGLGPGCAVEGARLPSPRRSGARRASAEGDAREPLPGRRRG